MSFLNHRNSTAKQSYGHSEHKSSYIERARCMRLNVELPKVLWVETINTTNVIIIKRSPSNKFVSNNFTIQNSHSYERLTPLGISNKNI